MSQNEVAVVVRLSGAAEAASGLRHVGEAARSAGAGATSGFSEASASAGGLATSVKAVGAAFSGLALVDFARQAASALSEAQQAADKLRNSLTYSAGGVAGAAKEMAYLREVTQALGLDFNSAGAAYARFAASTKGSGLTIAETKTVFEGISQAAVKLGLSASETEGALLAVSQMASKGTVQAEELRGQLGERLPGAFATASRAMGVTQAELGKMLEKGLAVGDFLPRFGRALKDEFGGAVNSLTQEINRLNGAWDLWKQTFAHADGGGMAYLTSGINESAAAMRALGKDAGVTHKILVAVGGLLAGLAGVGKFDTQGLQKAAMEKLSDVRNQREALQARGMNYLDLGQLDKLKQQEAELRATLEDLAIRRGKESGFQAPDLKGDFAAAKARRDQGLKSYLEDLSHAPKEVKVAAAVEAENKAFQAAVSGFAETDKSYATALQAHQERLAEIQKAPKAPGGGTKNDFAQRMAAQLAAEKEFTRAQLDLVHFRVGQHVLSEEQGIEETLAVQRGGLEKQAALLSEQLGKTKGGLERGQIEQQLTAIGYEAGRAGEAYVTALDKIAAARETLKRSALAGLDQNVWRIGQENEKLQEQIETLGLSEKALAEYRAGKLDTASAAERLTAANLREAASQAEAAGAVAADVDYYRDLADARQAAADALSSEAVLTRQVSAKTIAVKEAQESADAWKKFADDIERGLTDSLYRSFEAGKGFGETFLASLKNLFKTTVLKIAVQGIVSNVTGALGLSGGDKDSGSAAGSSGSALKSVYDLANSAKNAWNAGSQVVDWFTGGAAAGSAAGMAGALGSGLTLGGSGAGLAGALGSGISLGGSAGIAGGIATTGLATAGVEGVAATAAAEAATMTAAELAAAAVPVVGWIAAAGMLLYSAFGGKGAGKSIGGAAYSLLSGGQVRLAGSGEGNADKYNAALADPLRALNDQFLGAMNALGTALGKPQEVYFASTTKARGDGKQFSGLTLAMNGADAQDFAWSFDAEDKDVLAKTLQHALGEVFTQAVAQSTFSDAVKRLFAGLSDMAVVGTMADRVIALTQAQTQLNDVWGLSIDQAAQVAVATGATQQGLAETVGLLAQTAAAQKTASQTLAEAWQALSGGFSALAANPLPETLKAYDQALKGVDKTSQEGIRTFAALLALRAPFAAFTVTIDALKGSVNTAVDALRTPEDRLSRRKTTLDDLAAEAGIFTPGSADELVRLADHLDYTSASGLRLAAALPALVAAFHEVENAAKVATEAAKAEAATRNEAAGADRKAAVAARRQAQAAALPTAAEASQADGTGAAVAAPVQWAARQITDDLISATRQGVVDRLDLSQPLAELLSGAIRVVADDEIYQTYAAKGPGIDHVRHARDVFNAASRSGFSGGELVLGDNQIALAGGLDALTRAWRDGRIAADEYAKGLSALHEMLGEPIDLDVARLGIGAAASELAAAGTQAIGYLFSQIAREVDKFTAAAAEASAPIAQTVSAIAKMQATATAFGESAAAVFDGASGMISAGQSVLASTTADAQEIGAAQGLIASGQGLLSSALAEGSTYRAASLVGAAAGIAAEVLTTQSAADAAKALARTTAFADSTATQVRDASLLLDGLRAFDSASLQAAFARLAHALDTRQISEAQYVELFNQGVATFTDQLHALEESFGALQDAARSLADALLLDDLSTLTPTARRDEAQRQYEVTLAAARTGDADAIGRLDSVARTLLEASKASASRSLDYAATFGTLIRDLRGLEALGGDRVAAGVSPRLQIPAFAAGGNYAGGLALVGESGPELIHFNRGGHIYNTSQTAGLNAGLEQEIRALRAELAQLRADNNAANAAIAAASRRTCKALEKWDADGLPATTT